jgi:hypothetical protein
MTEHGHRHHALVADGTSDGAPAFGHLRVGLSVVDIDWRTIANGRRVRPGGFT